MESFSSKNLILLTGAGFTKNFGGFLAKEMWGKIFNNPKTQQSQRLRALLHGNYDFESVYATVMHGTEYSDEEKSILRAVIEKVYKDLDEIVRHWVFNDDNPSSFNIYGLQNFLNIFAGRASEKGFFFTLNQDLLLERIQHYRCPGAPLFPQEFSGLSGREFQQHYFVTLPSENVESKVEQGIRDHDGLLYIKLHGSYGWRSSDGSNQMAIGKNKGDHIQREPLLKCYFDLFQEVLYEENKRLMIIGYGFQDKHINEVIWKAAKEHNLSVYIIDPTPWDKFAPKDFVFGGYPLWKSIRGYFDYTFNQIFPMDQSETTYLHDIRTALLS